MELDGHACLKPMCFYWLWDGLLFISVVTDKIVSWLEIWSVHSTRRCHCHRRNPYIFSVLLRHTDARRSKLKKGNLYKFLLLRPLKNIWQTFWFPACSRELLCTNHTTVSQSQSYNTNLLLSMNPLYHCLLHFLLNKCSGAETSQWDCRVWPCTLLCLISIPLMLINFCKIGNAVLLLLGAVW